jgi:hypothetical protein
VARTLALPLPTVLLLAGVISCSGPPAEVVIDTHVGEQRAASSRERLRMTATALAEAGAQWWELRDQRRAAAANEPSVPGQAPAAPVYDYHYKPEPPLEHDAFVAQVAALREGPIDEIGMITRNLAEAGPALWPDISELLLAEREHPKRAYTQVLAVIGGDVPNRYGHFDLHWKAAHGYDVKLSHDWFEDLLGVAPGRIMSALRPVYRETLLTVALLRASSSIARAEPQRVGEIVTVLLDAAYVHDGTFRDEIGRAIDAIGDDAVPHLLRQSLPPDGAEDGSIPERRAAYATHCLDRMDRLHPSRALEAVADNRMLLADVLDAYALVREGEAAPLILAYVDTDAPGVRQAARAAFEAYVVGPTPQVRRKSIRLFNGQTSTQRAALSYREHARLAIRAELAKSAPHLLEPEPECELWLPGGLVEPKCEGQPERLFRAYIELLDERRSTRRDALVAEALASDDGVAGAALLDTLLTDGTDPVEPDLIAPFYAEVATELEESGETARAAALLRKSAMLLADSDPVRAQELTVDALLLEARQDGIDERGRQMLLATAATLDDGPQVSAALGEFEARIDESGAGVRERLGKLVLGLLAALTLLAWVGALLHRPRAVRAVRSAQSA